MVQLIVSNESEVAEKQRLAPLAEGVQIQVLYDVLKRKVDFSPLSSIYYIRLHNRVSHWFQLRLFSHLMVEIGSGVECQALVVYENQNSILNYRSTNCIWTVVR